MRFGRNILAILFGIVFMAVGIFIATTLSARQKDLETRCTAITTGIVTRIVDNSNDDGTSYDVTVEFELDGQKLQYTDSTSTRLREGESLTVHYDPNDHAAFYVDSISKSSGSMRLVGAAFAVIGLLVILSGIFKLIRGR